MNHDPFGRSEAPAGDGGQPACGGPLVVLTGPPAAGKSVVGGLLARRFGAAFTDTDSDVEAAAGKPAGDIFIEDGEPVFRDLERAAVSRALGSDGAVVALGSGAVLDAGIREMLAGRRVAYLQAGFATIARRLGLDRPRVVVPGNPRGRLRGLLEDRRHIYEGLARLTVPADELAPEEIADEIAAWLENEAGARPAGGRS